MTRKTRTRVFGVAIALGAAFAGPHIVGTASAQTVRTQDVSAQLQAGLESAAPVTVYFDFAKWDLTPEARSVLDRQAQWLIANPNAKVDLAGHTDAVGSNSYNDRLAMQRADAVQDYLFSKGVQSAQMRSVVSRGESDLAVPTEGKERRNRRVATSVTGLVDVRLADATPPPPAPAPAPPVRRYADSPIAVCAGDGRDLAAMEKDVLRGALETRLQTAAGFYDSAAGMEDLEGRFYRAAFAKSECGTAIGYLRKGIRDARSIANCDCFSADAR